jgi:hypothetical protein
MERKPASPWSIIGWIILIIIVLTIIGAVVHHGAVATCPAGTVWSTTYQTCVYG